VSIFTLQSVPDEKRIPTNSEIGHNSDEWVSWSQPETNFRHSFLSGSGAPVGLSLSLRQSKNQEFRLREYD
jgi:hypothetical protein